MSIDRCTEEDVCVTHNGIYFSHKRNGILSFVVMWMNLESIIQSEVSQKGKNKYHVLTHILESRKMVLMPYLQGSNGLPSMGSHRVGHD